MCDEQPQRFWMGQRQNSHRQTRRCHARATEPPAKLVTKASSASETLQPTQPLQAANYAKNRLSEA